MAKLTGARYIAEFFKAYDVTHYFFMPVSIHKAIKEMEQLGIAAIAAHSEKAAAYMADGYARISGKVGVCGAQVIGGTNLAAGLRDAFMARIPLVALTGGKYADTRYKLSYQEIDDMPIFEALTKFNAVVESPSRLPDLMRTAFRAASTGAPRPVHLELSGISGEVATGELEAELQFEPRFGRFPAIRSPAPQEDVRAGLQAIANAKRPIFVVGGGLLSSGAADEMATLARKLSVPVATSLNAKSAITDDDPLSVGVVGEYSRRTANTIDELPIPRAKEAFHRFVSTIKTIIVRDSSCLYSRLVHLITNISGPLTRTRNWVYYAALSHLFARAS